MGKNVESDKNELCVVSGEQVTGIHKFHICNNNVHIISTIASYRENEVYGKPVICLMCNE